MQAALLIQERLVNKNCKAGWKQMERANRIKKQFFSGGNCQKILSVEDKIQTPTRCLLADAEKKNRRKNNACR
jgi:hypothetical protein